MTNTPSPAKPITPPQFKSPWHHILYACAFLGIAAVFIMAAAVEPDPSGVGTHTRLMMPPCGFLVMFGKPCPSCGMTTAFAWMVRGNLIQAWKVQPAGVAVFFVTLAFWLYIPRGWLKRRPFFHLFELKAYFPTVVFLILFILGLWIYRLFS